MYTTNLKVVVVTGSARRIGACIATVLHRAGFNVIIHYRHSEKEAIVLKNTLNAMRHHSAEILSADLDDHDNCISLIEKAIKIWGRLDVLINNASTFAASPVGKTDMATWNALLNSNLKAPFFLAQAASFYLKKTRGSIVNITDIHAHQPMKNYPVYSCAKAGLSMLTKALALELAPRVRVNAVAPGNVLWPEGKNSYSQTKKRKILSATLLKKQIDPKDIAETVLFLIHNASITGQTIVVGSDRK